ncbi:MAG TPA: threonine synthase [Blastocatellia bacterium]|jgi:threonine synthase|nr:threonine synthase [Blastocatellia bacterium]
MMNNVTGFKCVECARSFSVGESEYVCPACNGNLDVLYDYGRVGEQLSKATLTADRNFTIWRYRALLPIEDVSLAPPLAVGWTPIYDCPRLAAEFGVKRLLIKDDGRNPTASFKDRPSALAVVKAREAGARVIATASSGNAGSALAGMCASVGMKSVIFAPVYAPAPKIAQLQIYGSKVALVEGSYDEAFDLCLEAGRRYGWYQRSTGYNPFMSEGKKTAALEIGEQLNWEVPDKVFVGMGDGCIIGGLWKGFNDLHRLGLIDRLPQMIGVQAEGASAIVDAANGDGVVRAGLAHTIADSINVGRPRDATKAIRAIRDSAPHSSNGWGVKVSDEEIIAAIGRLARSTGVFVEPAGAAAFAGFVKQCENGAIKSDESALLLLTGAGLKDVETARRASSEPLKIKPDIAELDRLPSRLGLS